MKAVDDYKEQEIETKVIGKYLEDGINYTYYAIMEHNIIRFATNPQSRPRRNEDNVKKSQNECDDNYILGAKCNYYAVQFTSPFETMSLEDFNMETKFKKKCILHGENEGLSRDLQMYLHCAAMRTIINNFEKDELKVLYLDKLNPLLFYTDGGYGYEELIPKLILPIRRKGYDSEWSENYILHTQILKECKTPDELIKKYIDCKNPINKSFVPNLIRQYEQAYKWLLEKCSTSTLDGVKYLEEWLQNSYVKNSIVYDENEMIKSSNSINNFGVGHEYSSKIYNEIVNYLGNLITQTERDNLKREYFDKLYESYYSASSELDTTGTDTWKKIYEALEAVSESGTKGKNKFIKEVKKTITNGTDKKEKLENTRTIVDDYTKIMEILADIMKGKINKKSNPFVKDMKNIYDSMLLAIEINFNSDEDKEKAVKLLYLISIVEYFVNMKPTSYLIPWSSKKIDTINSIKEKDIDKFTNYIQDFLNDLKPKFIKSLGENEFKEKDRKILMTYKLFKDSILTGDMKSALENSTSTKKSKDISDEHIISQNTNGEDVDSFFNQYPMVKPSNSSVGDKSYKEKKKFYKDDSHPMELRIVTNGYPNFNPNDKSKPKKYNQILHKYFKNGTNDFEKTLKKDKDNFTNYETEFFNTIINNLKELI